VDHANDARKVEHDPRGDTAYVTFALGASARQVSLGGGRVLDYAADRSVLGVEFLAPSQGLDLDGLGDRPRSLAQRRDTACQSSPPGVRRAPAEADDRICTRSGRIDSVIPGGIICLCR
jgi:uncharacterized protein YuzE